MLYDRKYFMTAKDLTWQQARWSLFLNCFGFVIHHRPGHLCTGPDGLSQWPDHGVLAGKRDSMRQTVLLPDRVVKCGVVV